MSTYKNQDGRWMVDVTIKRASGKATRVRRVSPVQNRRGAQKYEREVRESVLDNSYNTEPMVEAPRLENWCEMFVREHSEAKGLRPSTIREQRAAFRLYLLPVIGASTRVDQVSRKHVLAVRQEMTRRGLAPKTINNGLGVLTKALGFYYESRELTAPHLGSCRVKVPKGPPKFWEPELYERLVVAAAGLGPAPRAAVLLMGDCGLRCGEVIALEWGHLRWGQRPQIVVQRSFTDGNFGPTKNGRTRTLPMTSRLAAAVREVPRDIAAPSVLVRDGGHGTAGSLAWLVGNVERAAGLGKPKAKGKLHKLRHTYVTRLAAAGVTARTIMDLAGHTSMTTTMRYMHVVSGGTEAAADALEAFDRQRQDSGMEGCPKPETAS